MSSRVNNVMLHFVATSEENAPGVASRIQEAKSELRDGEYFKRLQARLLAVARKPIHEDTRRKIQETLNNIDGSSNTENEDDYQEICSEIKKYLAAQGIDGIESYYRKLFEKMPDHDNERRTSVAGMTLGILPAALAEIVLRRKLNRSTILVESDVKEVGEKLYGPINREAIATIIRDHFSKHGILTPEGVERLTHASGNKHVFDEILPVALILIESKPASTKRKRLAEILWPKSK